MMMELEGIECKNQVGKVISQGKELSHLWNEAILNGTKFYIDATPTWNGLNYFTHDEELFRESHMWE